MPLSKENIFDLLSGIPDPEIPVITIQELGVLRKVELTSDGCEVTITPTYTGCPAMQMIEDQIREILRDNGILNVSVKMTYSPAWTTDWLSAEAKDKLRKYGIAPPLSSMDTVAFIQCPHCSSFNTEIISDFGSTSCKGLYRCNDCKEAFDYFKTH
ncbi:MAG: 1,2-phenylacetyl-CoA epoxidase subunit PaaD [Bacteroidota bacterium]|nr:1,2-phenylacetyl-CoA epoxidase subunit PaaD [Bacteroidota bacterium]MDP4230956.1 1,2-phenylacetyl-CoA epoxidase subunit PaaD [Bacteroidota bacterium]MDP4235161.1 1,2-phenylacetyl-CoA epoxidase subunit PaaD [Bacteroidota bacterium]